MENELDQYDLDIDRGSRGKSAAALRLFRYALQFKAPLIAAMLMLAVSVGTELAGPLIAKRIIDVHISGIEQPWYGAEAGSKYAVEYEGAYYKRQDHFEPQEERGGEVRVLQAGREYVFVPQAVAFDGSRTLQDNGTLLITRGEERAVYPAEELSTSELYGFFRPELGGLLQLCWFYFALILLSAVFAYGQRYMLQATANRIIRRMRTDVFGQVNRLPVRYFDNLPAGKVVSRITNDTESIRELYVTVLANFFTGTIYMAGIFGALFFLDVQLAAICLFIVPVLLVWIYLYGKIAKRYNRIIRSTLSEINGRINESIQGMSIIRAFRKEKKMEQEFEEYNERNFTYKNKLLSLNSLTGHNLVGVIRNIAYVALIWYFGGPAVTGPEGVVSLGVLYAFVDYLNRLFNPIVNIVNQLPNMETALVSAERVFVLLDEEGEDVSDKKLPRYKGNVAFEDVWFAYKDNENVLKGINFEAKQGQTVALIGHTGSGKSSIINLLFRFYDVNKGRITIDGVDTRTMPRQSMREHMGIVLQDPFLFTGTIATNVSMNDPSITRERIEKALADVGADRALRHLPSGIDEPVLEKGSTLSAGQRQLISFARALAFDPAILILDEATSNIDTETEALIQDALEVVKKGRTTFIIAHRLSTIKNADLILVLDRGEIVERGNHEELIQKKGKYFQMYQLQQGEKVAAVENVAPAAPAAVMP
ncbi:multidrug ABC transporter permease [Paenibacillus sambharensis]|uniref:Multidrug ABC transporter permease n=1 Tax=Paenibacillus sambharensis TaxID=1803190 RepID=A0A2W1LEZ4_9BACL|nr:ABC transporter ATP-binding protein [Paenibacillus sambharensis]PZD97656.1 multidrug ABC transporter permease [Paenibacillus sambharensis]